MKFLLAFHVIRSSTSSSLKTASWLWAARRSCKHGLPLQRGLPDFRNARCHARYFSTQGFTQVAPQRSRSSVLRVTTVRSCCRLVAAMRLSITGNGRPCASDTPTSTPQRAAMRESITNSRPLNRSASSRRTHCSSVARLVETGSFAIPFSSSPIVITLRNKSSSSRSRTHLTTDAFGLGRTNSERTQVSRSQLTNPLACPYRHFA